MTLAKQLRDDAANLRAEGWVAIPQRLIEAADDLDRLDAALREIASIVRKEPAQPGGARP